MAAGCVQAGLQIPPGRKPPNRAGKRPLALAAAAWCSQYHRASGTAAGMSRQNVTELCPLAPAGRRSAADSASTTCTVGTPAAVPLSVTVALQCQRRRPAQV
jgi:hypothetical protein